VKLGEGENSECRSVGGRQERVWLAGERDILELWTPTSGAWACQTVESRPMGDAGEG
jgi:hypothetical protein